MAFPAKDPDTLEPFYFVWCSKDGTNDGSATDTGELQGATISSQTVTVPSGITKGTVNTNSVSVKGVTYSAGTVVTVWLSGGTDGEHYDIECSIDTSDGRTGLTKTESLPVKEL